MGTCIRAGGSYSGGTGVRGGMKAGKRRGQMQDEGCSGEGEAVVDVVGHGVGEKGRGPRVLFWCRQHSRPP
eukprot:5019201-Prorocentrum_lima.AAC.1